MAAAYALFIIYMHPHVLVHADGIDGTCAFAGSLKIRYGVVRAGLMAPSAFTAFVGIYMGLVTFYRDRTEITGIETRLCHTLLAVVRHDKARNGTTLACRRQNLHGEL